MHNDPNLARKPIFWAKVHGFGLIDLDSGFWYPNSGFGHPHLDLTNPDLCLWHQDSDLLDLDSGLETQILTPGTHILALQAQIPTTETQILDSWDQDTGLWDPVPGLFDPYFCLKDSDSLQVQTDRQISRVYRTLSPAGPLPCFPFNLTNKPLKQCMGTADKIVENFLMSSGP